MDISITHKDELTIMLLHYFITEQGYTPIVIHGTKDEIWLENLDNEYKIIRLVSSYIHNNEQYKYDSFKTKKIVSKILKKTFLFKTKVLNIFTDLGENVTTLDNYKNFTNLCIKDINNLKQHKDICKYFKNIDKIKYKEEGIDLFMKLTNEINAKTEKDAKKIEKIFGIKKPIITYGLIIINVLIFLLMYLLGNGSTDSNTLIDFGALYYPLVKTGQYYRIITSTFLHIGFAHILFNMYALAIVGNQVESLFGKLQFLLIYLISAISGSLFSMLFTTNAICAGASGAIFGLFGALLYFGIHYRIYLGNVIIAQILPTIILNLIIGFTIPGIDISAHIGGLVGGILAAKMVGIKDKSSSFDKTNGFILTIIYFFFMIYILFLK